MPAPDGDGIDLAGSGAKVTSSGTEVKPGTFKLTEFIQQALSGTGSNASVTVESLVVGRDDGTGAEAARIIVEVPKVLNAAGVSDAQVLREVQQLVEDALQEQNRK